jgi:AcrR family transcriptional regulator
VTLEAATNAAPILSPQDRKQRNREQMQRAILEAARAVMREQGVAALNLREVARRVKVQAPSLYAYYPSKMALYDALFLLGIRIFRSYWDPIALRQHSFRETLRVCLEAYMRFAQEHPDLYQLCFECPVPGFVPSEESMAESRDGLEQFDAALVQAITTGRITPAVPPNQARDLIIAMMHGLTSQHMANEPGLPVGTGRYGGLIPAAIALFQAAWEARQPTGTDNRRPLQRDAGGARKEDG